MRERRVVVFGGGAVATRRVESLVSLCHSVVVVSFKFTEKLERLATHHPNLKLIRRRLDPHDGLEEYVEDADLVMAATSDPKLNSEIVKTSRSGKKLVNRVDCPQDSDVIFPAVLRRGDVIVAVSTRSPLLSKELRRRFRKTITTTDARMAKLLGYSRRLAAEEIERDHERRRVLKMVASDTTIKEMLSRGSLRQAKTQARRIILGYDWRRRRSPCPR